MIKIELLSELNFNENSLDSYVRKQDVKKVYRREGCDYVLVDMPYKEEARKAGAKALYISACSSEETIAFYKAMGAELTDCPIKEIAEDEPYDLQMVCYV